MAQMSIRIVLGSLLLSCMAGAQQVRYIDLSAGPQRKQLRHPPAKPTGHGVGGGIGSASVGDGAPDHRDPRALEVSLTKVAKDSYRVGDLLLYEVVVKNTGSVPIEIPVHPHLSDLQPDDPGTVFDHLQLGLAFDIRRADKALTIRGASLYGRREIPETILMLEPGQWISIRGVAPFEVMAGKVEDTGEWELNVRLSLQAVTVIPKPGGIHTSTSNMYPRMVSGRRRTIHVEQE